MYFRGVTKVRERRMSLLEQTSKRGVTAFSAALWLERQVEGNGLLGGKEGFLDTPGQQRRKE